jgi:hypothetical protein
MGRAIPNSKALKRTGLRPPGTRARSRVCKTPVVSFADTRFGAAIFDARQKFCPHGSAPPSRGIPCLAGRGIAFWEKAKVKKEQIAKLFALFFLV